MRKRESKPLFELVEEWDAIAPVRIEQIISGRDITFPNILLPGVLSLLKDENHNSVLDAGCGVGVLTTHLSGIFKKVVGVDPSPESIRIANENFRYDANFLVSTMEDFSKFSKFNFNVITANMVLMDVLNLDSFLEGVARRLRKGGAFIFTMTHPCFWPEYYGYRNESWFRYNDDAIVESPFRISYQQDCRLVSTHVHRPLERYIDAFSRHGLLLEEMREPFPDAALEASYPSRWEFPRYIIGRCRLPRRFA
ncbi:class I SAM-dependent methyltransferase [Sphingopyxis sp. USTB-05]|uniref:class I SAM-dependent DNA methyltransferase n=1 Tax=Sphingopyxis sp. USTB-05 TaxID=2830667 RepID=UPI0020784C66|nr:class I SAM-dependent methyltransferase [Sphingopyxis sp. USTB-05]USI75745.1 class I SAM-dependent methyltransferase [Sphingopyxis sp. USTB-05]